MNKGSALLISLILVFLIALDLRLLNSNQNLREKVILSRAIDGDTISLNDGRIIRLLNINSPEKDSPLSLKSIELMKSLENKTLEIEITGQDKYKRYLARVYFPDYLNLYLIRQGLASKFLVDESELTIFFDAEEEAIKLSRGIWTKSKSYGCIHSKIDQIKERVIINNSCPNLNFANWQLKDESRKIFVFPNISFISLTLNSGLGDNNSTDIYWNSKEPIWNNDRDTLYLFNEKGELVHHEVYGY